MAANDTLGLNIEFPIYNADGTSFQGLVLKKSTYDSIVMSLGDKVTGDVYYKDNTLAVSMQEYIVLDGVKYVLVTPPTVVRDGMVSDNGQLNGMTKYSFVFYHPMYMLGNFPFADVAVSSSETKYLSESKKFTWVGYPDDFIAKINKNLDGTEWIVVKSSRFPAYLDEQLSDVLPFDGNTISDACKTFYETWGAPYVVAKVESTEAAYASGKRFKVIFGLPSNEIYADVAHEQLDEPFVFQFGKGVGLKNNSRTPRNNKIVTRIAGYGSENNIPYGYPQIPWYGDSRWDYTEYEGETIVYDADGHVTNTPKSTAYPLYMGIVGGAYVKLIQHPFTRKNLMPSIYGQTLFNKVSPYLSDGTANPNYNPDTTLIDYYDAIATQEYPYPNPIVANAPSYESHEFEDVKPELGQNIAIVDAYPINKDLTPASSWDDSIDDDGNYVQSYFKMQLPVLSFDIYACAAITQEMQINMRSGACLGCTFTVQVDWDDYKANFYDADGNFAPTGSQRDYTKYPDSSQEQITVVLQKDTSTFGTIMPNVYQYPVADDTFVVLGISLPLSYITNAETRLDAEMKSYMLENNVHYFDYPLKFDEAFLRNHTYILSQIKPNAVIRFKYGNDTLQLFVKQLTVKYGDNPLPQYDITLTDNVEVVLNQIGRVAEDVEKLGAIIAAVRQNYNRSVWAELEKKLSKTQDDTAAGYIRMLKGLQVGSQFVPDILGQGGVFRMGADGKVELVTDRLYARVSAYFDNVEIRDYRHSGGNRIASQAQGFTCSRVEWIKVVSGNETVLEQNQENLSDVDFFRCYWRVDDGEKKTDNQFIIGDLAFCESANVDDDTLTTKRYWRVVVGRNSGNTTTADGEAWVDLSNAHNANGTPKMTTITYQGQGGVTQTMQVLSFETGSGIPEPKDDICQLGDVRDTTRQGAIIEYVTGVDAPSYQIFQGIGEDATNPYSLTNKNQITIGYNSATGHADLKVYGDAYIGDPNGSTFIEYKQDDGTESHAPVLNIKARINASSTIGGQSLPDYIKNNQNNYNDAWVHSAVEDLQSQIDGEIDSYFYNYLPVADLDSKVPLTSVEPYKTWYETDGGGTASEVTTERTKHLADTFYDNSSGYAFRFTLNENTSAFEWTLITDSAVVQALANAAKAQETADGKRTIYSVWNAWVKNNVNTLKQGDLFIPTSTTTQGGITYKAKKVYKCTTDGSATFEEIEYTDDSALHSYIGQILNKTYASGDDVVAAAAQRAIQGALNGGTLVDGGLLLSSLIGMRKYDETAQTYTTWGGISGMFDSQAYGNGLAAWFGGAQADMETMTTAQKAAWDALTDAQKAASSTWAKIVNRFDGSGYLASNNIKWTADGKVYLSNIHTASGQAIDNYFFEAFAIGIDGQTRYINPQFSFNHIDVVRRTGAGAVTLSGSSVLNRDEMDARYVKKDFFDAIFKPEDSSGNRITTNGATTALDRLKILVGTYTDQYLSALGLGDDSGGGGATTLSALNDVAINNLSDGQMLVYDLASTHWVNRTISLVTSMSSLTDVVLTSLATNQILKFNGTNWVNADLPAAYTLPTASSTTKGGVKVGSTLAIASEILNLASGIVTTGTYRSVTVDTYGRVTAGTNPTTIAGYGITDAKIADGVITLGANTITPLTSHQTLYTLSIYGGTTKVVAFKPNADASLYIKASGDISLTNDTTNKYITLSYSHPTNGADTSIAAADGRVLSAITVNSLGHVTSVSYKALAAADIPDLSSTYSTSTRVSTLEGYFTSGVANKAEQLNTSRTLWGQSFNGTANVSGNMTNVGNITMSATNGTYIQLGDIRIVYDSANDALKIVKSDGTSAASLYATGGISALGQNVDGQAGAGDVTWALLADGTDTRQIALSHLTTSLTTITGGTTDATNKRYAVYKNSSNQLFVDVPWQAGSGTVTSVKVGTTSYTPTNGVVSLPAYPTSLPASDVYSWAKQSTKPSYTLDEVGDGSTRKLANYLPLAGGTMNGDLAFNGDGENDFGIHLNEGGTATYGADILYGANDTLKFGTRENSTTPTIAMTIARGSTVVDFKGTPTVNGTSVSLSNHTHSYLPLSGGTLSGKLNIGSVTTSHATKLEVRTANTTANSVEWGLAVKNPYNDATNYKLGAGIRICLGADTETTKFGGIAYIGIGEYFNSGKLAFYASGAERAYLTSDNLYIGSNAVCHAGNSSVSKSGETLSVKINNNTQSITNTWRGIQNNLTSDSTTDSLSAAQGKALANGSARDNTKLPLSGGTMSNTNVVTNLNADLLDGLHLDRIVGTYTREQIGTSPNFDNPSIQNGLFELRVTSETTGETGTKPFDGFAPFLTLKVQNVMMQLAGGNAYGWFIRGKQSANVTLENTAWQQLARTTDNVASATKLQTARTLWGNSFDGTANIGGTITFDAIAAGEERNLLYQSMAANDFFRIRCGGASNAGWVEIATADDGNEPIYVRQYIGVFANVARTLTLLDGSGNTSIPNTLSVGGALNVTGATTLTGLLTANGGIAVPSSKTLKIGDAYLSYDLNNNAIRVSKNADGTGAVNFYAIGGVSALGQSSDGSAGSGDVTWALLASNSDTRQIALSHLTTSLGTLTSYTTSGKNYAVQKDSSNHLYVNVPWENTTTTYSAGKGLRLSGTQFISDAPRVAKDSKAFGGANTWIMEEYTHGTAYNLPSDAWYHIMSTQGTDTAYGTQLALGMTTAAAYYRVYNGGSWGNWQSIINTWRGIQDNLTSTSTTDSLSAKQGYLLANGSARDNTKLPLSGGTISNSTFGAHLTIERSGSSLGAAIAFKNSNGILGYIGMSNTANGGLQRWNTDTNIGYLILDSGNSSKVMNIVSGAYQYTANSPLTHTSANTDGFFYHNTMQCYCVAGEKYTISCETDGTWSNHDTSGKDPSLKLCSLWVTGDNYNYCCGTNMPCVWTCPTTGTYKFRTNTYSNGTTALTVHFWNFKVERGQFATDWNISVTDPWVSALKATKDSDGNAINTTYLKLGGGTMTGGITCYTSGKNLVWGNITIYGGGSNGGVNSIYIGDDVTIGDCNIGGSFGMKSTGANAGFRFFNSSGTSIGGIQSTAGTLQWINSAGTAYNILDSSNSSVSKSGETLTVKINGTSQSLTNTNTTYSASTGLSLSGTAFSINSTYQTYISHGETAYGWGNHANAGYAAGTTRNFTAGGNGWTVYAPYTTDVDLDSYYLSLSGGTMTGHIYLGGVSSSSADNTTQIIFGTASNQHIALSSNPSRLIINPSTSTSSYQVCLSVGNNNFDSYVAMNSGNFGIGTDNPTQKLYVNGNAYANNYLTSSGNGAYVQIGAIKLVYDSANNAIKVIHSNGGNANLYATGGVSALGAGQESGGGGGGGNYLPLSGGIMTGTIGSAYYNLAYSPSNPYLELIGGGITTYVQNYQNSMYIGFGVSNSIKIDSDATLTTKNVIITNGGIGDSPYLEFRRGTNSDDYTDWRIIDTGGLLCFRPKDDARNWNDAIYFDGAGGVNAAAFNNTSDIRKKNVIKDVDLRLDQIAKAPAFEYYWLDPSIDHDLHVGTSAQYWQSVLPEVVTTAKDEMGTLSMQYGVAALISAITVARKVMTHEEKIALLETRVSSLEKENGEQEQLINSLQKELEKFKAA